MTVLESRLLERLAGNLEALTLQMTRIATNLEIVMSTQTDHVHSLTILANEGAAQDRKLAILEERVSTLTGDLKEEHDDRIKTIQEDRDGRRYLFAQMVTIAGVFSGAVFALIQLLHGK